MRHDEAVTGSSFIGKVKAILVGLLNFWRASKTTDSTVDQGLREKLEKIAEIKDSLLPRSKGWCNELSLFVQRREAKGMVRLQAGGKYHAHVDLWQDRSETWKVRRYQPGEWEALVDPTLNLAQWLAGRGGLAKSVTVEFQEAIRTFELTVCLELPEGVKSFLADSQLARILPIDPTDPGVKWEDVEIRLRTLFEEHLDQAAPWDALNLVYIKLHRFAEALRSVQQALTLAPHEPGFHFEAAMLYLSGISNAIRAASGEGSPDAEMEDCTLGSLGRNYDEARSAAQRHLEAVVKSTLASPDYRDAAHQTMRRLPELDRTYKYLYPTL